MSAIPQSRRAILTALYWDAALFNPGYERDSSVAPSDYNVLVSGCRLIQTALYRDTASLRLPCIGIPPYSDRLVPGTPTSAVLYKQMRVF